MSGDRVFLSEAELEKYLIGISPSYAEYAPLLWRAKVTRTSELAAASVEAYKEAGVPSFVASNIKARADAALKAAGTGKGAGPSGGVSAAAGGAGTWPCALPPATYEPTAGTASTSVYQCYPTSVVQWQGVESEILAVPPPNGVPAPDQEGSDVTIRSGENGIAFLVTKFMMGRLQKVMKRSGLPGEWVPCPPGLSGFLSSDAQLTSIERNRPDWVLLANGRIRSFSELTRPEVLRNFEDVEAWDAWDKSVRTRKINPFVACLTQVMAYASMTGCRYGVLTTYFSTWVLRFDPSGLVEVSRCIKWTDTEPSAEQALWFLTQVALGPDACVDAWPAPSTLPPRPGSVMAHGTAVAAHGEDGSTASASGGEATPPNGGDGDGGRDGAAAIADRGTWLLEGATDVHVAGHGSTGDALAARLADGREVVVKHSCEPELIEQLQHEVRILTTLLHKLMGKEVVQLVGHGWGPEGRAYWLATDWLPGRHPDPANHPEDAELLGAAATALRAIHAAGVVHGDIREYNIRVVHSSQPGSPPHIVFLDFGMAKECTDPQEHAAEQQQLPSLFAAATPSPSQAGATPPDTSSAASRQPRAAYVTTNAVRSPARAYASSLQMPVRTGPHVSRRVAVRGLPAPLVQGIPNLTPVRAPSVLVLWH